MYFDIRRTRLGAELAINARFLNSGNLERTHQTDDSQKSTIGTQVAAPKVLDNDRESSEDDDRPQREGSDLREEKVHLDICHLVIRTVDECSQG